VEAVDLGKNIVLAAARINKQNPLAREENGGLGVLMLLDRT